MKDVEDEAGADVVAVECFDDRSGMRRAINERPVVIVGREEIEVVPLEVVHPSESREMEEVIGQGDARGLVAERRDQVAAHVP